MFYTAILKEFLLPLDLGGWPLRRLPRKYKALKKNLSDHYVN